MVKEVKISLRGALEDLPEEMAELLEIASAKMRGGTSVLDRAVKRLADSGSIKHALVDLEEVRLLLYKLDNRIGDCMSILEGYAQHHSGAELLPEPDLPPEMKEDE